MSEAMEHITEQITTLKRLDDRHDQRHMRAVIFGMVLAYYRMGKITETEFEAVDKIMDDLNEHKRN